MLGIPAKKVAKTFTAISPSLRQISKGPNPPLLHTAGIIIWKCTRTNQEYLNASQSSHPKPW